MTHLLFLYIFYIFYIYIYMGIMKIANCLIISIFIFFATAFVIEWRLESPLES